MGTLPHPWKGKMLCVSQVGRPVVMLTCWPIWVTWNFLEWRHQPFWISFTRVQIIGLKGRPVNNLKNINTLISNRLVKMRLAMLQYDLDVTYLPGRQMVIADLLSRNYLEETYENEIEIKGFVHDLATVNLLSLDQDTILKVSVSSHHHKIEMTLHSLLHPLPAQQK